MPLQRRRRIFRSSLLPRPGPVMARAILVGVAGVLIAGGLLAAWREADLFSAAPPPSGHLAADPAQIAVIDGGTLRVDRQVVRLLGVDPPPRGESCGNEADCGSAAANALAGMVRQKPVTCALHGQDGLGRPLGVCDAAGTDLNRAVVAAGWARAGSGLPDLQQVESGARADRRGLWANP